MRTVHIDTYQRILLITVLLCLFPLATGNAAIPCYQCHGTNAPVDYRPVDALYRNISTSGFKGNHRAHMDSSAMPVTYAKCHPKNQGYTSSHRDGSIKVSININRSIPTTLYNNTSAFLQTSTPNFGICTNVNCHFESTTPA